MLSHKLLIISFVIFTPLQTFGQRDLKKFLSDSLKYKRIYIIDIDNQQTVVLREDLRTYHTGEIINTVWKIDGQEKEPIKKIVNLSKTMVAQLMDSLEVHKISKLRDYKSFDNHPKGKDSTITTFTTFENGISHTASYYGLFIEHLMIVSSDNIYPLDRGELYQEYVNARKLFSIVKSYIDWDKYRQEFISKLPKGKYDLGSLILEKS